MNNFAEQTPRTNKAIAMLRKACAESSDGKERWRSAQVGMGDYLTSLRRKRKLSQQQVAKLMGVSQPFLAMLEQGQRDWTEIQLERWDHAMEKLRAHHERIQEVPETQYSEI